MIDIISRHNSSISIISMVNNIISMVNNNN